MEQMKTMRFIGSFCPWHGGDHCVYQCHFQNEENNDILFQNKQTNKNYI